MKKIIALDIDGTLTNSKKEVTQPTLDKIIEIQEKGHVVAIASGRPLPGIRKIADTLHLMVEESLIIRQEKWYIRHVSIMILHGESMIIV